MKSSQPINEVSDGAREQSARAAHRAARKKTPTHVNTMRAVDPPTPRAPDAPARSSSNRVELTVPRDIARDFVRVGKADYHFQNGVHAFTNHGDRFTTTLATPQIVAALLLALESNGVKAIDVTGSSAQFRQRAWRAAVSSGFSVVGYTPTEFEKAKFLRDRPPAPAKGQPAPDTKAAPLDAQASAPIGTWVVGTLLAHGRDTEGSGPDGKASYYVRLETQEGERTVRGRDLERALEASRTKPQVGNTVGVRALDRDQLLFVNTAASSADRARNATSHQDPFFVVEKSQFFSMRRAAATVFRDHDIPSDSGVARYPELDGVYALLKAAGRGSARTLPRRADRFMFLQALRQEMAEHIERGEPVPTLEGLDRALRTPSSARAAPKIREPLVRS